MDSSIVNTLYFLLLYFFILLPIFFSDTEALSKHRALNNTVSAIFVFGDSTADPGNNNYLRTIFKGNFPPYGRDFRNQVPTGRFSNGRLAADYIVSYVGIKDFIPPYLDPTLSLEELTTGVSFASAGSGFDPLTPTISGVVSLPQQLVYFKEYKRRLEDKIGEDRTERVIKNAVFLVSAGTNDFVINYFTLPIRRKSFTISGYQQFVLQHVTEFLQGLSDLGARRTAMVGLPPMGCLPMVITLHSVDALVGRQCLDTFSSVARDYNALLQLQLAHIQRSQTARGLKLYYADIYGPMEDMIQRSKVYGLDFWCVEFHILWSGPLSGFNPTSGMNVALIPCKELGQSLKRSTLKGGYRITLYIYQAGSQSNRCGIFNTIISINGFNCDDVYNLDKHRHCPCRILAVSDHLDVTIGSVNAGFEDVSTGCCGTGLLEASFLCNPKSFLCYDASKYIFWDSIHPTEKTYYLIFQALRRVVDSILMDG